MKKIIFGILLCIVTMVATAQGTLQFNKVLLLTANTNSNVTLGTVPNGKVWKVTGFGTSASSYSSCNISFNGSSTAFRIGSEYNYSDAYTRISSLEDFWLPAGTTITAVSCNYYRWLSIIEFNVVP